MYRTFVPDHCLLTSMSKQTENISHGNRFWFTGQVITWELQQRTNSSSAKPAEDLCGDAFDMAVKPHLVSVFPEGSRK